jgi:hypothetical protein
MREGESVSTSKALPTDNADADTTASIYEQQQQQQQGQRRCVYHERRASQPITTVQPNTLTVPMILLCMIVESIFSNEWSIFNGAGASLSLPINTPPYSWHQSYNTTTITSGAVSSWTWLEGGERLSRRTDRPVSSLLDTLAGISTSTGSGNGGMFSDLTCVNFEVLQQDVVIIISPYHSYSIL